MRYKIEEYKRLITGQGRVTCFRIIDTFNGGKVIDSGFRKESYAQTRCHELNDLHNERSKRDEVAYEAPVMKTRACIAADVATRVAHLIELGHVDALDALRIVCGADVVDAMIDAVYNELRAKAVR